MELLEDGGAAAGGRFVADGLQEDSGWTFQVGGTAGILCACWSGVFSGWVGAGRCHDSDAGRLGA